MEWTYDLPAADGRLGRRLLLNPEYSPPTIWSLEHLRVNGITARLSHKHICVAAAAGNTTAASHCPSFIKDLIERIFEIEVGTSSGSDTTCFCTTIDNAIVYICNGNLLRS